MLAAARARFVKWTKPKARSGSGLPARAVIRWLVWGRRLSQAGFLFLFCWLLFATAFRGSFTSTDARVRLPQPRSKRSSSPIRSLPR